MAYIYNVELNNGNSTDNYLIEPRLYGTSSYSNGVYTVTLDSSFTYSTGVVISTKITTTNAASATLKVNSLEAKSIYYNNALIEASVLKLNHTYSFVYNGIAWELIGDIDTNTWRPVGTGATDAAAGNHGHGNISNGGALSAANQAVVTDGNNKITTEDLSSSTPSASGTATAFVTGVTQNAKGKLTSITKANLPNVSKDTAGLAPKGAEVNTQSQSTKFLREDGSWAAPSYTTNTNNAVTQTGNTENKEFSILLKNTNDTTDETAGVKYGKTTNKLVTVNPSTGTISAAAISTSGTITAKDNITLISSSTNATPALIFQRAIANDSYTDWKIQNNGSGDLVISQRLNNTWTDEVTLTYQGKLTAVSFAGSGSNLTSLNASNISSGTLNADRLATSGATAGSYGPSAAVNGTNGTTMNVPYITVDDKGRVTAISNKVYTAVNTWRGIQDNLTSSSSTTESLSAKQGYLLANGSARDNTKLSKITYEYNKEISFGQSGKLLIGKFPCYDSNITIQIFSTTSTTYHAVAIMATQNINTSGGGTIKWNTYGDSSNTVTPNLYAKYASGSNIIEIYFSPSSWSKNIIHISCVALRDEPTNICENISSIPEEANIKPTNTLNSYATNTKVDELLAAADAMIFKGTLGTNGTITTVPDGTSDKEYQIGYTYKIITAGTYAGMECEIGDLLIAIADSTSGQTEVNDAHWTVAQTNIDGAVTGPTSATDGNIALFDGETGKIIKNSSYSPSSFAAASHGLHVPTLLTNSSTAYFLRGDNAWSNTLEGLFKITSKNITVTIGSTNSSWVHFTNNKTKPYYFDNQINANGGFKVYDTTTTLTSSGLNISSSTAASNTTTGSIITAGGISTRQASWLTGPVHIVGAVSSNNSLIARGLQGCNANGTMGSDANDYNATYWGLYLNHAGGPVVIGSTSDTTLNANTNNLLSVQYSQDASSSSTGALTVAGGVGIAKKLYVGTGANITGTTTIQTTAAPQLSICNTKAETGNNVAIQMIRGGTSLVSTYTSWQLSIEGGDFYFKDSYDANGNAGTTSFARTILQLVRNTGNAIVTGDVKAKTFTVATNNDAVAHLLFGRSSYNYIAFPSGGELCLNGNTSTMGTARSIRIGLTTDSNGITGGYIYPGITNKVALGSSDLKWSNIYATTFTGNLSGNATSATGVIDAGKSDRTLTIRYGGNGANATDWIPMHDSNGNLVPVSSTNLANKIRDKASGSWGISITGNANTATTASSITAGESTGDYDRPVWFSYQENGAVVNGKLGYNNNFTYNPSSKTLKFSAGVTLSTTGTDTDLTLSGKRYTYLTSGSTMYISNADSTSLIFRRGTTEYARFNTQKGLVIGGPESGVDVNTGISEKLYVNGKAKFLGEVTATAQIKTSFKDSIATGSYASSQTTIPNLLEEVRYSSGCMGSFNLGTAYTLNNITIAKGWYNFMYIPHRSGGVNGAASGDNCDYGILYLHRMNASEYANYIISYSNKAIQLVDLNASFKSSITDGQILISDGTSGHIKTSGYTIATSVPSNAVFTDHYAWGDITNKPTSIALTGAVTANATTLGSGAISITTTVNHGHGYISSTGQITDTHQIANGDRLIVTDSANTTTADKNKLIATTITFDGSTKTKALTQKGTWETFNNYSHPTDAGNKHIPSGGSAGQFLKYGGSSGTASWDALPTASTNGAGIIQIGTGATNAAAGDHNHDSIYLKLDGGTMTGDIAFTSTGASGTTGTSKKITWSGSTDNASIYYTVPSADAGRLVINTGDDTNCLVAWAYKDSIKAYINNSTPSFYPATTNTGSIGTSSVVWANIYATTFHGALEGNASTASAVAWSGITGAPENVTRTTDGFMSKEDKIKLDDMEVIKGTQTGKTGAWTGTSSVITSLYDGLTIKYYLNRDPSGNASLNLTLADGSTTGAIPCYYNSGRLTTHYAVGSVITLTYFSAGSITVNGTATTDNRWIADANYDSGNTNTLIRTFRSSTNVELPIIGINASNSATATFASTSINSGSYAGMYGAIPETEANRATINPSTGMMTVPGGITANLTGDVSGNASTATRITAPDTRSTNESPSTLMGWGRGVTSAFKYRSTVDSPNGSGTYGIILNLTPWGDSSGSRPKQLWIDDSSMSIRHSTSDSAWSSWSQFVTNSGTWGISITGNAATTSVTETNHPSSGSKKYYLIFSETKTGSSTMCGTSDFYLYRTKDTQYLNLSAEGITGGITFYTKGGTSGKYGDLVAAACTAYQKWTLPNATGTIALTSSNITGSAASATNDSDGNAINTTYVKKVTSTDKAIVRFNGTDGTVQDSTSTINDNGTMTINGRLIINPKKDTSSQSYNEGIRINQSTNGWANIQFGGADESTSGTEDGQWLAGRRGAAGSKVGAIGDFSIEEQNSIGGGLTIHKDNGGVTFYSKLAYNKSQLKIWNDNSIAAGKFGYAINAVSTMAATANSIILVGAANSNKNQAYLGFHYEGSGLDTNYLTLGLYGADHLLKIFPTGQVNIATNITSSSTSTGSLVVAGGTGIAGALYVGGDTAIGTTTAGSLGLAQTNGTGLGISLYGGPKATGALEYGIMFAKTATFGTCGSVTSTWATYFTMNREDARGWIFKSNGGAANGNNNVASIAANGNIYTTGSLTIAKSAAGAIYLGRSDGPNWIQSTANVIAFCANSASLTSANAALRINTDTVDGYNDNYAHLGSSSVQWKDVHSYKYIVEEKVTLQWNAADQSLDFIFA